MCINVHSLNPFPKELGLHKTGPRDSSTEGMVLGDSVKEVG